MTKSPLTPTQAQLNILNATARSFFARLSDGWQVQCSARIVPCDDIAQPANTVALLAIHTRSDNMTGKPDHGFYIVRKEDSSFVLVETQGTYPSFHIDADNVDSIHNWKTLANHNNARSFTDYIVPMFFEQLSIHMTGLAKRITADNVRRSDLHQARKLLKMKTPD